MTVFGDDADAHGLHGGADEGVDVVVTYLAHPPNLAHRFAANLLPLGEVELLHVDVRPAVGGHFGEDLVHRHARQAQLPKRKRGKRRHRSSRCCRMRFTITGLTAIIIKRLEADQLQNEGRSRAARPPPILRSIPFEDVLGQGRGP